MWLAWRYRGVMAWRINAMQPCSWRNGHRKASGGWPGGVMAAKNSIAKSGMAARRHDRHETACDEKLAAIGVAA
jgi:hypothetical protein